MDFLQEGWIIRFINKFKKKKLLKDHLIKTQLRKIRVNNKGVMLDVSF